jgi:hypothetical protein
MNDLTIKDLANKLKEDGIVIVPEFWSSQEAEEKKKEIEKKVNENVIPVASKDMGYKDMANYGKAIVSERNKRDKGMLDIFNIDLEISELSEFKNSTTISEIINTATDEEYSADNLNVYFNKTVTRTRGYHADTYKGKFKAFLYLTDVPDNSYGPFSYIRGSHKPSNIQKKIRSIINSRVLNKPKTNALFVNRFNELKCTAPKGTLIIANQAGLHRGTPQEKGKVRMLLNTSYTPTDKK